MQKRPIVLRSLLLEAKAHRSLPTKRGKRNVTTERGRHSQKPAEHTQYSQKPMCCSVLQCVAVCCSVLQCVAVCCSVLQCVAVCCSVLTLKNPKNRANTLKSHISWLQHAPQHTLQHALQHTLQHALQHTLQHALQHTLQHIHRVNTLKSQ